jgi:putative endonuclease
MPSTRQVSGARAERRVRLHYRLRGYRVLDSNVRAGGNELDIVVRRGRRLVFCEVKMRSGAGYGDPWEAVGPEKERRLRRAAEAFLARSRELGQLEVAFEVAAVRGRRIERVPLG